jgi:hypothetical protein
MEKIDILVKGVPVPIHNMFKGICSMSGKSVSDGVLEAMVTYIESASGGQSENLKSIAAGLQGPSRKR